VRRSRLAPLCKCGAPCYRRWRQATVNQQFLFYYRVPRFNTAICEAIFKSLGVGFTAAPDIPIACTVGKSDRQHLRCRFTMSAIARMPAPPAPRTLVESLTRLNTAFVLNGTRLPVSARTIEPSSILSIPAVMVRRIFRTLELSGSSSLMI
jgi:hypothetical protein